MHRPLLLVALLMAACPDTSDGTTGVPDTTVDVISDLGADGSGASDADTTGNPDPGADATANDVPPETVATDTTASADTDASVDVSSMDTPSDSGAEVSPTDASETDAAVADTLAEVSPDGAGPDAPAGGCEPFTGTALDMYDLALINDPATLDLEVVATTTEFEGLTAVTVQEIRYTSYEYEDCQLVPVRIEAYLAIPNGVGSSAPGIVAAHGLGGFAKAGSASTPAAEIGVIALAYSGPGQGASEGWGAVPDHLFDTVPDPRNSWFWGHAMAAMRGLTVLANHPDVDPSRLGMTGYSGGGVATYMVNGVDPRVVAAAPVSATGHMDLAINATPNPGWQADLLDSMTDPKTKDDPEWAAYLQWLDPKNFVATAHGPTLIIDGAQDEFFPINTLVATFDGLNPAHENRVLTIKDWDHGWFALFNGQEPAETTADALQWWFQHHFGLDGELSEAAPMPQVDNVLAWTCVDLPLVFDCTAVTTSISTPTDYTVEDVAFHWSIDGGLTFLSWNLQPQGGAVWAAEVATLDPTVWNADNTAWFVEYTFRSGLFGLGKRLVLTSRPHLPPGFSPNILPIAGPVP